MPRIGRSEPHGTLTARPQPDLTATGQANSLAVHCQGRSITIVTLVVSPPRITTRAVAIT